MVYEAVGDGSALSYFYVLSGGRVFVRQNLRTDSLSTYTLRLRAYDSYYAYNYAETTCTISVIRNPNAPVFTSAVYEQTINEDYPVGDVILSISANDLDGVRMSLN